ncbi:MAG: hypothetical protein LUC89_04255 [Oscillospiraceae bacterium]|nr:hypothetical protein [Oscillospiraceae bacterium]
MDIDQSIQESLAGFETLWRRVSGAEQPKNQAEEAKSAPRLREEQTMETFIQAELCAAAFDKALARMLQGKERAVLLAQAEDAGRRAGRLRAEYFICTGTSYTAENIRQPIPGKLAALRAALLREERLMQDYTQAAGQTAAPVLQTLYTAHANGSAAHAQALRNLLTRAFR